MMQERKVCSVWHHLYRI